MYAFMSALGAVAPTLGDDFIVMLCTERPEFANLVSTRCTPAAARRLVDLHNWQSGVAEYIYTRLDGEGLTHVVMKRNETRAGALSVVFSRGRLGADVQRKVTRRKLSEGTADQLVGHGLVLDATEQLLERVEVNAGQALEILGCHADVLPVPRMVTLLRQVANTTPMYAAALVAQRHDVRAALLAERDGDRTLMRLVSAIALTPDEQHQVVAWLDALSRPDPTVMANMLDRPTTVMAVREAIWPRFAKSSHDTAVWPLLGVHDWPEVSSMGQLTGRDIVWVLQRARMPEWGSTSRTMQLLELFPTLVDDTRAVNAAMDAITSGFHAELRARRGLHWLAGTEVADQSIPCPTLRLREGIATNANYVAEQQANIAWAATHNGITSEAPPTGEHRPVPEPDPGAATVVLGDLNGWDRAGYMHVVNYLVARLGDSLNAWRVALQLAEKWQGTAAALADTALASVA